MATYQVHNHQTVILLENLVTHKTATKLARYIFHMLISVGVISTDILCIAVDKNKGLAFIHLRNKAVEDYVIALFSNVHDVMNFFDVRKVAKQPRKVKVTRKVVVATNPSLTYLMNNTDSRRPTITAMVPYIADATSDATIEIANSDDTQASGGNMTEPGKHQESSITAEQRVDQLIEEPAFNDTQIHSISPEGVEMYTMKTPLLREHKESHPKSKQEDPQRMEHEEFPPPLPDVPPTVIEISRGRDLRCASTSMSGLPVENSGFERVDKKVTTVEKKTSTPQVSPCFCPDNVFYHRNQHIGNESRHVEFKQNSKIYDTRGFRPIIGRYLCAFLNTEGGTIYFGVNDDGRVVGIEVTQRQEDRIRLAIDQAVTSIKPAVPITTYSVNFANVMDENGQIEDNVKVLEICVKPRQTPEIKHSFENNVYMRLDGSVRTV